jgi:hypothetical protein
VVSFIGREKTSKRQKKVFTQRSKKAKKQSLINRFSREKRPNVQAAKKGFHAKKQKSEEAKLGRSF